MVEQYPVSNEISGARRILFDTETDPRHDYSASQDPHRSTASRPQSTSPMSVWCISDSVYVQSENARKTKTVSIPCRSQRDRRARAWLQYRSDLRVIGSIDYGG